MFTCSRPGCCYDYCSLCGRLQDAVTIVHSVAVCRLLLPSLFTLWPFAGGCYHHCSLCGCLQDALTIIYSGHLQDTVMIVYSVAVCRISVSPSLNMIAIPHDNRHIRLYDINGVRIGRLPRSNRQVWPLSCLS